MNVYECNCKNIFMRWKMECSIKRGDSRVIAIILASVARVIIRHLVIRHCFQKCFQHISTTLIAFKNFKHSTNDALDCLIHKFRSKKSAIKCKSSCFSRCHFASKCHGVSMTCTYREIWGHEIRLSYTFGIYFICDIISTDEDLGLRIEFIESFAVINLRGVSTNKSII
jgi:hypothetical protein